MTKKQTAQYASAAIVIGLVLMLTGAYQMYDPVLAVEPIRDQPDLPPLQLKSMLATTQFEVAADCPMPTVSYPNSPEITFDGTTATCRITIDAGAGHVLDPASTELRGFNGHTDTYQEWTDLSSQLSYATQTQTVDLTWTMFGTTPWAVCGALITNDCTSSPGWVNTQNYDYTAAAAAQIDDTTDTLTTDQTSYHAGDVVKMTATGTNIGEETWNGRVFFKITQPSGESAALYANAATVYAGQTTSVSRDWTLPTNAMPGTWKVQSTWKDNDGIIHAQASIDLGTETIWGIDINVLGGLMVLLGLILAVVGFAKRKQ